MSGVLESIKSAFRKKPRPQQLPPGTYPGDPRSGETLGTITKPPYPTDDDDDDDDDFADEEAYNVRKQTQLRGQNTGGMQSNNSSQNRNLYGNNSTLPPTPLNPSNTSFRGASSGFVPGLPLNNNTNNNMNPSPNMSASTTPNLSSRGGMPFPSQIQDPSTRSPLNPTSTSTNNSQPPPSSFPLGMNPNQSTQPPSNNPQPLGGGLPPGTNPNQSTQSRPNNPQPSGGVFFPAMNPSQPGTSTPTNPQGPVSGSPPGMNLNQTQGPPNNTQSPFSKLFPGMNANQTVPSHATTNLPMNAQHGPSTNRMPSFRNQSDDDDNVSRLELDYPIENVLIDSNIPSTIAIKINEAVEQDRLGNAYHIHRYTFEPSTPQHITLGNHQHMSRHLTDNPYHGGTRHIREIHNDHQNSFFHDTGHPGRSHNHDRHRRRRYSETSLNEYVEKLLLTPGSTVIQAQNPNNIEHLLGQHLPYNQMIPTQSSIYPFQSNTNTLAEPVFYYTARALPNDPMRIY